MTQSPGRSAPQFRWIGRRFILSLRYLFTTEVHAYGFSIAANALLSFFPFTLILLAVCQRWLRWESAYQVILQLLRANLPAGADFVIRNLKVLAGARPRVQVVSVLMLFFTSSGIFVPLEVALNRVWGIQRNRNYLRNLGISFVLAVACGLLALFSILSAAAVQSLVSYSLGWVPSRGWLSGLSHSLMEITSVPLTISIYFVIYYFLPNGKVSARRVFPAAVLAGLLTEFAKFVYTLTLPLFRFREIYGPFSLSVTLLFWAFIGSMILLWGAHLSAQSGWQYPSGQSEVRSPASEVASLN